MSNANNGNADLRLIEDYLPIEAISAEASREKSVRKGHISTLHLWWARRPLVACRAAVYGALVPADRWVKDVDLKNPSTDTIKAAKVANGKKKGLNRKAAKEFVTKLCRYPKTDPSKPADVKLKRDTEAAIVEAQKHILEAHAERLTAELANVRKTGKPPAWVEEYKFKGDKVTHADIIACRAPRPRVLDMFAGGGAIPLEALRLGCEAHALELNPVAYIIELCTLVYPQKYGKPDPTARGMTGPKNAKGGATWGGLAAEVRYWGNWVLDRVRKEIGDLYPPIPDPAVWDTPPEIAFDHQSGQWNVTKPGKPKRGVKVEALASTAGKQLTMLCEDGGGDEDTEEDVSSPTGQIPPGFLQPVAYLWTRTVQCKNPGCAAAVPLVRQTWLCRKSKRKIAAKPVLRQKERIVTYKIVDVSESPETGFDPAEFSEGGNATCPFCGTVADQKYVKSEGLSARIGRQLISIAAVASRVDGKSYLSPDGAIGRQVGESEDDALRRATSLAASIPNGLPCEPLPPQGVLGLRVQAYGITSWDKAYTSRQLAFGASVLASIQNMRNEMSALGVAAAPARAVRTYLGLILDKIMDRGNSLGRWYPAGEKAQSPVSGGRLPMTCDFPEVNPFGGASGSIEKVVGYVIDCITALSSGVNVVGNVSRGSATVEHWSPETFDAIVTDPPYYDNVPYSNLSDIFYVWMKRSIGPDYPEHFAATLTPRKSEAVADPKLFGGNRDVARAAYEQLMGSAFAAAAASLKAGSPLVCVYAHKTTLGWATIIDALRRGGFVVVEAWPIDTEAPNRERAQDSAALASSISIVAVKRADNTSVGSYEGDVQPELQQIVRERVETLWDMGIAGADLVIACVGAGLRAFTKYERVEYANGEEVPAEKFLAEVEGVVLDTMMGKLSGVVGGNVSAVDNASRFYVLWRFVYKTAELDAGEAIIFANGTHIELDGPQGLSAGKDALVEKKKAKYRARDFSERGKEAKLGLPSENGQPAPLIDALHRILWLMENSPRKLNDFLDDARLDRERLRALAQALAGAALSGKSEQESAKLVSTTPAEQAALGKLLANWRSLVESRLTAEDRPLLEKQGR